jgi:hypothetical protein
MAQRNLLLSTPWWLGFFLTANLYLVPSAENSPRSTDLLAVFLGIWLLLRAHRRGLSVAPLAAIAAANLLPLYWLFVSFLGRDMGTLAQMARWILAIPWAIALVEILRSDVSKHRFLWGLIIGCAVNIGVVGLQYAGVEALLRPLGIAAADTDVQRWYGQSVRFSGLHRHYGASSAVASLIVPATLVLFVQGKRGWWLPMLSLVALAVMLHLTFTRSPLVVSLLCVVLTLFSSRKIARSLPFAFALVAVGIPALLLYGPPGGNVRWQDTSSTGANVGERATSNRVALELIIENPLGLGVSNGHKRLLDESAIGATHNAFLQAGLYIGAPLALALLIALLHHMWGLVHGAARPHYWTAIFGTQLVGLFAFEEHLNNPTFVILASWLLALSASRLFGRRVVKPERSGADSWTDSPMQMPTRSHPAGP